MIRGLSKSEESAGRRGIFFHGGARTARWASVKKTFETAHDAGCHLIAQVKAKQPGLLERVEQICQSDTPTEAVASRDYGRCRQETRTVLVFEHQK